MLRSVVQMAEKDGVLELLRDPNPAMTLNSMKSWELEGLNYGIHQLENAFRNESKFLASLKKLRLETTLAKNHVGLMNGLELFLDHYKIPKKPGIM